MESLRIHLSTTEMVLVYEMKSALYSKTIPCFSSDLYDIDFICSSSIPLEISFLKSLLKFITTQYVQVKLEDRIFSLSSVNRGGRGGNENRVNRGGRESMENRESANVNRGRDNVRKMERHDTTIGRHDNPIGRHDTAIGNNKGSRTSIEIALAPEIDNFEFLIRTNVLRTIFSVDDFFENCSFLYSRDCESINLIYRSLDVFLSVFIAVD